MGIIVEDGSGVAGANSYTSVAFADSYFEDRGVAAWAAATEQAKASALIRATDYIESLPVRWKGKLAADGQALKFPRDEWVNVIPVNLQRATAQYALRALTAKLLADPTVDPSGQAITSITKKVDVIEKTVSYADPQTSPLQIFRNYPEADALLGALAQRSRVGNGSVIR